MCLVTFSKTPKHSGVFKFNNSREKKGPMWAYISITDSCSHKCSWCYGNYKANSYSIMSIKDFDTITDKLLDIGIKQITISGGEPTEHPDFLEFVELANVKGFYIHIATHGEYLTEQIINQLILNDVKQIQMNFQGLKRHNAIHGKGYSHQIEAFKMLQQTNIETVATVTIGAYNIGDIGNIFKELESLQVTRLRVIDSTGRGTDFRKNLNINRLFSKCKQEAKNLGYNYTLSYDPDFKGDITVPCVQLSNVFMDINTQGELQYCGAVLPNIILGNFIEDRAEKLLDNYIKTNKRIVSERGIYCAARVPNSASLIRDII